MDNYNKLEAIQAQKALNIAQKTLEYTKKGLDSETSIKISEILCKMANVSGAVISSKSGVFSYYGEKIDESDLKRKIEEFYLKPDINTYLIVNAGKNYEFFFAPIVINNEIDGVIGMELKNSKSANEYFVEFLSELSSLLSMQIELFKLNEKVRILNASELKALRAQIEPHFLFNTLNTISSFCRTNPLKARELIIDLSKLF
ncbi:histidine kinase [Clostridium sp. DMHC 10]|uniref:histidine kinase n=1 Tax=Clostridium sp. DMHC 10 TaxID=747377 RepID=UPI00069DCE05|nr:histidine kinase [Clostridium sp. DMHC 10]